MRVMFMMYCQYQAIISIMELYFISYIATTTITEAAATTTIIICGNSLQVQQAKRKEKNPRIHSKPTQILGIYCEFNTKKKKKIMLYLIAISAKK